MDTNIGRPAPHIFLFQKDEYMLLPAWVEYHAGLVGLDRLHIVDNGSTVAGVIDYLFKAAGAGVDVRWGHAGHDEFENKGNILLRMMNDARWDEPRGGLMIPLDCDEFLAVRRPSGEVLVEPSAIMRALQGLPAADVYEVRHQALNVLGSISMFVQAGCCKHIIGPGFFNGCGWSAMDVGYHLPQAGKRLSRVGTDLCYLHLHHKPYRHYRECAEAKMSGRTAECGMGTHLLAGLSCTSADEYVRRYLDHIGVGLTSRLETEAVEIGLGTALGVSATGLSRWYSSGP